MGITKAGACRAVAAKGKREGICCLCGGGLGHHGDNLSFGNNPEPLGQKKGDRCCDNCNFTRVLPARLKQMKQIWAERQALTCETQGAQD